MFVWRPVDCLDLHEEIPVDWIIERKTISDLLSSLNDGRYLEQKYRLKKSCISNVVYLIEGNV